MVDIKTRSLLLLILCALISSVIFTSYLLRQPHTAPLINGVLIQQTQSLPDFTLVDHQQRPFTKSDLRGRWHFVVYGYTHCPDICPITLSIMSTVVKRLNNSPYTDTGVVFYSVDPTRDTPQHLAEYVPHFHPDFVGLTHPASDDQAHIQFERGLGLVYETPATDVADYPVNHGVTIYLLNPEGDLQAIFTPSYNDDGLLFFSADLLYADYLAIRAYLDTQKSG